ncbi:unnamed protein product [Paramecium sonneborni]|uniref:Transmembrane protein n=1 Tax=Paramecium sonneborni TaxID=65129 RepID=A0A8S1RNJ1_9CILI|nr:unnamed protein product [Paramecium sonneborni]
MVGYQMNYQKSVIQFVVMELFKVKKNVIILIQYLIILVINANIHIYNFVKFLNLEFVYNVKMDLNFLDQKCQLCEIGWILIDNTCQSFCGDGVIALNSIEQCDDGNQIENDGCFDCQIECIPNCLSCFNTEVCFMCQEHFQIKDQSCLPICGDGFIIIGYEQCDDGNIEPYDGCNQCQYDCSQGCLDCENEQICRLCQSQYILNNETAKCQEIKSLDDLNKDINNYKDQIENTFNVRCSNNYILINNQCVNQCGNGWLDLEYEQCDDGNLIGGDGCTFYCFEEDSYQCQNTEGSMSLCSYILGPKFMLNRLSSEKNQTQVIELRFTQKIKLLTNLSFEEFAAVSLIPDTHAAINIKPIVNLSTIFDSPIYQIFVEFIEPVKDPVLQIDIAQFIIKNEQDLDLINNQSRISLGNPFVLSETTQKQVTQILLLNDGMIYSMISISGLSLLAGNTIMLFNLLDLLQSLSYIRFMQYSFPPHLIQFLDAFTKISLKPILDYFRIDEILSSLNGGSLPFQSKKSSNKYSNQLNQLNQFYLLNAKSCYFSIIVSLITYIICNLITSHKFEILHKNLFQRYQNNYRYLLVDGFFTKNLQKFCNKFKQQYFSFGIFKVYIAILHQLLFSAFLQFPDYSFNSPLMVVNSINAIIGLMVIIYIGLQLLSITSSKIKDKNKWLYFYQDQKLQFWAANFRPFQIYRIMFYIFTIVVALNYPQVQSILLSMSSFFYLSYILKFKPIQSNYEYAKLMSREFFFILITGSFLIYSFEFDENQLLLYGWIHITLFTLMLISNLIIDLIENIDKALQNYKKKKNLEKIQEIKTYHYNSLQKFIEVADLKKK